ncbi:MAG: hypothetical protein V3V08_21995 [Nannocystaceae bacterium]
MRRSGDSNNKHGCPPPNADKLEATGAQGLDDLRDLKVHPVGATTEMTTPKEPALVGDWNEFANRSGFADPGRLVSEAIGVPIYVKRRTERMVAQLR